MINKGAVYHRIGSEMSYAIDKNRFLIRIKCEKEGCSKIVLRYMDKYLYFNNHDRKVNKKELKKIASDYRYDYYEIITEFNAISLTYYFEIYDKDEKLYYGNGRFYEKKPVSTLDMYMFSTIAYEDIFETPEWTKNSIIYQIFPERFYRGDNFKDEKKFDKWDGKIGINSYLGGNLNGVIDKLEYLEELGINTLYLTPVFEAGSNHKYNTFDYFKIDKQFGNEETLIKLVKNAHKRGMRVILDAVFNHCGTEFFAFKDLMEKQENSEYKNWFEVNKFPLDSNFPPNYKTFGYFGNMPKLMMNNRETAEYFFKVCTYWIQKADIDGWRIDVADEISHQFWKEVRKRVKAVKQDAIIIGEVWYDSNSWLQGDEFDTVMNYDFYLSIQKFLATKQHSAKEFDCEMGEIRGKYKLEPYNILWSLIDSHDTARFLHTAKGNKNLLKLALIIQMTTSGNPIIYYGDEIGMSGGADPDCRRGMIWDDKKRDKELFEYYKKMILIRKQEETLRSGETETIKAENGIYIFKRINKHDEILIVINRDKDEINVEIKGTFISLISGEKIANNIVIAGETGEILKKVKK